MFGCSFTDENDLFFFKDSMTASISTQRNTGSSKALNKPSLDILSSSTWVLEEKSGKGLGKCYSFIDVLHLLNATTASHYFLLISACVIISSWFFKSQPLFSHFKKHPQSACSQLIMDQISNIKYIFLLYLTNFHHSS